ncbi:flagellar biosynthetic protein FlhB [bacterium BMS3Bbin07]|nr:flagellar biosynthetic protein FlhB [bacterium BMS3Bbin07]HDH01753.1 flagellar biosynthesis protein FlhB [Nitrospirota bacterium]
MADDQEKTEQATPQKRQKGREEGRVARSREFSSMLSMGGVVLIMIFMGHSTIQNIMAITREGLTLPHLKGPLDVMKDLSLKGVLVLLPFMAIAVLMAIAGNTIQGGFVLKPLKLEVEKINPIEGIKRMFSRHAAMEFLKGLVKFITGALLLYFILRKSMPLILDMMAMDVQTLSVTMSGMLIYTIKIGFICFFVISILDYINERWKHERSLRMSKEEVKEEYKSTEGDPHIKARIRSIQKEMARKRMMQEVPKATVIITNPTHLAVALKYERAAMGAPKVIAKGAGFMAERIKDIAGKSGIPIVEDKPIAQALFKLDVDTEIPEILYRAVARILSYIYKLRGAVA